MCLCRTKYLFYLILILTPQKVYTSSDNSTHSIPIHLCLLYEKFLIFKIYLNFLKLCSLRNEKRNSLNSPESVMSTTCFKISDFKHSKSIGYKYLIILLLFIYNNDGFKKSVFNVVKNVNF